MAGPERLIGSFSNGMTAEWQLNLDEPGQLGVSPLLPYIVHLLAKLAPLH
jgi:hypothetical protein